MMSSGTYFRKFPLAAVQRLRLEKGKEESGS